MDALHIAILVGAGIIGGLIATWVGGASVVTFPAMLAAGLPPPVAMASNLTAMTPGVFSTVFIERARLPPFDRKMLTMIATFILGGVTGALLLLLTPARTFEFVVPLLLALATLLFAVGRHIGDFLKRRSLRRTGQEGGAVTSLPFLFPVAVYNGYFGAGAGVMVLAVLAIWSDLRTANVLKNFLTCLTGMTACLFYIVQGMVDWRATLLMMIGGFAGSIFGNHVARDIRRDVMEKIVTSTGVVLTVVCAWKYWF